MRSTGIRGSPSTKYTSLIAPFLICQIEMKDQQNSILKSRFFAIFLVSLNNFHKTKKYAPKSDVILLVFCSKILYILTFVFICDCLQFYEHIRLCFDSEFS